MAVVGVLIGFVGVLFAPLTTLVKWMALANKTDLSLSHLWLALYVQTLSECCNDVLMQRLINRALKCLTYLSTRALGLKQYERQGYWIRQPDRNTTKLLLYIHGGGFTYDLLPTSLFFFFKLRGYLNNDIAMLALNYPTMQNCSVTNESIWCEFSKLNRQFDHIYLIGDSAGGNLVLNILVRSHLSEVKLPERSIVVSPWSNILDDGAHTTLTEAAENVNVDLLTWNCLRTFRATYTSNLEKDLRFEELLNLGAVPRDVWQVILTSSRLVINYGDLEILHDQISTFINHVAPNFNLHIEKVAHGFHISPLITFDQEILGSWASFLNE